ncbi:LOW QUALITY PROTEIN: protein O-mannosyl-transferase 1-like [Thamnophis elegans]|uniref:LOW QUALITY PROTEIN: protein O-mannosyl-transferase 1-like n=1 Tax=Thamnophis elegans TaxID=35005 RepID=UPI00137724F0|nr:LOW QUALITY PROTEIN: protein O-mannosyl-transferase 1-like [Thamnophis elegans]
MAVFLSVGFENLLQINPFAGSLRSNQTSRQPEFCCGPWSSMGHWKILTLKNEDIEHTKYSSSPLDWITLETNVAYRFHSSSGVILLDFYVGIKESRLYKSTHSALVVAWMSSIYLMYHIFRPLTYGEPALSKSELQTLRWKDSWDILIRQR